MADFLEVDFCRQRSLRINRRFDVDGIASADLASGTSLGCRFPISHRANGPGYVLSRADKQTGRKVSDLLFSPDETDISNPGPTAWLSASPERHLSGSASLPYPAARPVVNSGLTVSGATVAIPFQIIGFGTAGLRNVVVVPPGNLEYLDPGPLADHDVRQYFRTVSSSNLFECYRLVYQLVAIPGGGLQPRYVFRSAPGVAQGASVTQFVGNFEHNFSISVVGTPPALTSYVEPILTPTVATASTIATIIDTNGPDQIARKFSHPLVATFTNPGYNETLNTVGALSGTRPTMTVFKQSGFEDHYGGFDVFTVNGESVSFSGATLPADQFASVPFTTVDPDEQPETFYALTDLLLTQASPQVRGQLHGLVNQAGQFNIDPAATTLTVRLRTADNPGGLISEATLTLPKPANQLGWFELLVAGWTRRVGAL